MHFHLIPLNTRYDFVGKRNFWVGLSVLVQVICMVSIFTRGFNYGVDFAGGTDVQVSFKGPDINPADINNKMREAGYENAESATFGDGKNTFLIRLPQISYLNAGKTEELRKALQAKLGEAGKELFRKDGGFAAEGGRVELGLTKMIPVADIAAVFNEQKIPLRRGVELTDQDTNEYVVRLEPGDMTKEQFQKAKDGFKAKFAGALVFEDIEQKRDRATMRFNKQVAPVDIEKALGEEKFEVADPVKILRKERNEYIVHMVGLSAKLTEDLNKAFAQNRVFVERVDSVGPKVGEQLRNDAIAALLYAIIGIMLYVAFRFQFLFAPGVVISLLHDAIITVGFFSLFHMEFTLGTVAAVLTVIGYSVNDTIVTYDRIRENTAKYRDWDLGKLLNLSINETLGRTVVTTLLTLFTVIAMLLLGGGLIKDFAVALLVGMLSGVYSTVFVAAPITIWVQQAVDRARARRLSTPPR